MRTDAKIGFAIGGVLLAVLTVYAIVVPKHPKKSNTTVSLVTTPVTPVPVASSSSDSTATPTTITPPPIAAASDGSATGAKDIVTPSVTSSALTGPAGNTPMVDNTATPVDAFHPLATPKDLTKSDEKPGRLVDGVYTPDNAVPIKSHKTNRTATPLPDDTADASTAGDRVYVIKSGQTLSKIAYEVYGNSRFWVAIQRENKGLDSNHLKVGSKINLPDITPVPGPITVSDEEVSPMSEPTHAVAIRGSAAHGGVQGDAHSYIVKSGDSLYGIAKRVLGSGRKADALYALNKDVIGADKSRLKLGMVLKLPEAAATALADTHSVR